jgi:hypothetical protein
MGVFYLQRDGLWIEEVARSTRPDSEAGDIVFKSVGEAVQALSGLYGKPRVREVSVTDADVQAYINRIKDSAPEELFRQFLARYRAGTGKA